MKGIFVLTDPCTLYKSLCREAKVLAGKKKKKRKAYRKVKGIEGPYRAKRKGKIN